MKTRIAYYAVPNGYQINTSGEAHKIGEIWQSFAKAHGYASRKAMKKALGWVKVAEMERAYNDLRLSLSYVNSFGFHVINF